MTRDEILALSDEALNTKVMQIRGWTLLSAAVRDTYIVDNVEYEGMMQVEQWVRNEAVMTGTPDFANNIAAAWELFDAVYDKRSQLYGGVWVLGVVDDRKDCAQATLFLHLPWRARWKKAWKSGKVEKVEKYQVTEKPGRMARAITLAYVLAMEDVRG